VAITNILEIWEFRLSMRPGGHIRMLLPERPFFNGLSDDL
jgi:hypothetical protein